MRKVIAIVAAAIFLGSISVYALDFNLSYRAKSGDKELDAALGNLNAQAKADRDSFIADLSINYGVPKIEIEKLILNVKMSLADVYMTVKIGNLIRKPLPIVVDEYKANRGRGWGVIAQNLGIKPGSAAFHALKNGASDELGKAKGRGKGKAKSKSEGQAPGRGRGRNK